MPGRSQQGSTARRPASSARAEALVLQPAVLLALLCGAALPGFAGRLEGQAQLRQPFPLPEDALLDVQLLEASGPAGVTVLRARSRSTPTGRGPFGFVLPYVDGSITPGRRYQVRATIRQADRLLFSADTLIQMPATTSVPLRVMLDPLGTEPLRGLLWLRAPAAGVPAPADAPRQEQQFRLDPISRELTGSGDCNRFIGTYQLQAESLQLEPAAGTRLDCEPSVVADEQTFLAELRAVRRWRLDGQGRLQLFDAGGQPRLLMETRPR